MSAEDTRPLSKWVPSWGFPLAGQGYHGLARRRDNARVSHLCHHAHRTAPAARKCGQRLAAELERSES